MSRVEVIQVVAIAAAGDQDGASHKHKTTKNLCIKVEALKRLVFQPADCPTLI